MRSNGSVYVAVVIAALVGYFSYQWWFNPARAIKLRLGQVAAALSVPAPDSDIAQLERLGQLRKLLASDVRVDIAGEQLMNSREAVLGVVGSVRPAPGGIDVQFVDTQVTVDSADQGRAYLTVRVTTPDRQTGERTIESREATVTLARRAGEWVVTSAALKAAPTRP
ncbi:MAG TPA: nuclear transport factor 2 family protein [Vicinamibacterales bacterium]|nr:nuclear transport factor 2 family protein [Vicinamibacterales bacterium]